MSGLSSLRKWQKCQRGVAKKVLRAAGGMKGPNAAELKRAANALASIACSKKKVKAKKGVRRSTRASARSHAPWAPPDFARHLAPQHEEGPFNPETF